MGTDARRPGRSVIGWMEIKPGPCLLQRWFLRPLVVAASILRRDQAAGYLSSTNKSRKSTFMRSLIFTIYLQNILCGFTQDGPEQKHTERRPSRSLTSSHTCAENNTRLLRNSCSQASPGTYILHMTLRKYFYPRDVFWLRNFPLFSHFKWKAEATVFSNTRVSFVNMTWGSRAQGLCGPHTLPIMIHRSHCFISETSFNIIFKMWTCAHTCCVSVDVVLYWHLRTILK